MNGGSGFGVYTSKNLFADDTVIYQVFDSGWAKSGMKADFLRSVFFFLSFSQIVPQLHPQAY